MKPQDIVNRCRKLHSQRMTIQEIWNQITLYIAPYRGRFFKDERSEHSIEWRQPWVYDSTAIMASQALAAHLHSRLTSPSFMWFGLRFRTDTLNDNREASEWLDECARRVYNSLQDSNFNVQSQEGYQDLVDYGTSFTFEEEETDYEGDFLGLNFSTVPLKEAFFEQDAKGQVLNFFRRVEMTYLQIVEKFGYDNVPEWIQAKADDPECPPDEKEIVIFGIYRRFDIDKFNQNLAATTPPNERPYGYCWVLDRDSSKISEEGGYYEMPVFAPRWRTTSSSKWGNSPAMVALSDVLTLNRLIEFVIQSAEKVIDPPTLTTERGLISDLDLNPAGLTVVRDVNEVVPYESKARFDVSYEEIKRIRDQIREYFMVDQLQLPPMEGTPATATEISTRVAQLEKLIGPTLGRLMSDYLDPLIGRTFNILFRAGQLPEMPQIVQDNAGDYDIEYVGALARTLQQDQVDAVDRWLLQIGTAAQLNPDVLDIPDWDAMMKGTGKMVGVPAKFIKGDDDIKNDRKEREAMQRAQMEGELMQGLGKGMQDMAGGMSAMSGQSTPDEGMA